MKRLFTFGCSFTNYRWPTWADIVGQSFDYYENWGASGSGNYSISTRLMECNHINNINENDVVLIMTTSIPRLDYYTGHEWSRNGNIFNWIKTDWEKQWFQEHWSLLFAYYQTWVAIKQIKLLLENIGCEYKITKAFDITGEHMEDMTIGSPNEYNLGLPSEFIEMYNSDMEKYFDEKESMQSFASEARKNIFKKNSVYKFPHKNEDQDWVDYHPTILQHELWCRKKLPEYYTNMVDLKLLDSCVLQHLNFTLHEIFDYEKAKPFTKNLPKFSYLRHQH